MPPKARRTPYAITTHGDTRIDNYYWLRDDSRSRPEVLDYLHEENDYGRRHGQPAGASGSTSEGNGAAYPQRDVSAPWCKTVIAIAIFMSRETNIPSTSASLC